MTKILFVCHGSICRSPMAEFIFRDLVKKAQKKGELTEDDQKKAEKDIQDLTDKYIKKVDEMCGKKDKELMEI